MVGLAQDSPTKRQLKSKEDVNSDNLIDKLMIRRIMLMGGVMLLITLPVFNYYKASYSLEYARTMALLVLSAVQWFNALNVRSRTRSVFTIPLNNNFLNAAFVIVLILQFVAIETTFGNKILHTVDINIGQWVIGIALATSIIWVEEIRKYFVRKAGKLDTSTAKVPAGRLAIDSGG